MFTVEHYQGSQTQWDEYVINHHDSTIYHLYNWGIFFKDIYKFKPIYLAAYDKDRNIAGLALLIFMRNHFFQPIMVSLPFFCTGCLLFDNLKVQKLLLEQIRKLTKSYKCNYTLIRLYNNNNNAFNFIDNQKVTFVLPLEPDSEKVFKRVSKQIRRRIRKGYKSGCEIAISKKYIDAFYEIYRTNMHYLGSPVHKKSFYSTIIDYFPENYTILVVLFQGQVIGAQLLSYFKDTVYLPLASSLRHFNKYSPNHLLYWESIKYGCEKGYSFCDFGRSTKGSGPYVFKKQWNAQEIPLTYCYFNRNEHYLRTSGTFSFLDLASKAWRHLPINVTNFIGPYLSKWLP